MTSDTVGADHPRAMTRPLLALALLFCSVSLAAAPSKRITLDVDRADIHDVLRMLAEVSRLNIVASDDVSGKLTLKLRNVTWQEALEVVLNSNGLGYERKGNIVRVAPLRKLAEEAELRARIAEKKKQLAPLKTFIIPVNYANAAEMAAHVKPMLSERGTVTVDARTNSLIIRDVEVPAAL